MGKYVEKNGGLCSEKDYKYTAKDGQCEAAKCGTKYDANSGYMDVTSDSSTSLKSAVAEGCVSVAIEADQTAFQHYSSGVLIGSWCVGRWLWHQRISGLLESEKFMGNIVGRRW